MSNHQKNRDLYTETNIVLGLIFVFLIAAVASYVVRSYILTAVCTGLVVTALLYRFFGGVKGSTFRLVTFKAGGSVAVFAFVAWFVNGELVKQHPRPVLKSWVEIDKNGKSILVTPKGRKQGQEVSDFLRDVVWGAKLESGTIRVAERGHNLGEIDSRSLYELGLFDRMEMNQNRTIQYTGPLNARGEENLRIYPYKIKTTKYTDNYNGFSVLHKDGELVLEEKFLRTKDFLFFKHRGKHFMIFVSRAAHNDPNKKPWAVFGFTQVNPTLRLDSSSDQ